MLIFTAFLHYIGESHGNFHPTAIECIFYPVEAAKETVHVVDIMETSGNFIEASPFVVDALVFASMALLMAARSHYPIAASTTSKELVSTATEMLQQLSKKSDAARDCAHLLSSQLENDGAKFPSRMDGRAWLNYTPDAVDEDFKPLGQ